MTDLNKKNITCNSTECYLNNEYWGAKGVKGQMNSCQMCSLSDENLLTLREEIKKELMQNRKIKTNQLKTRFIEYTIAISAGGLFITYVAHFINKIITGG